MSDYNEIYKYIKQNRNTYTSWAINEELLRQGYSRSDIDSAWHEILRDQGIKYQDEKVTETGKFWWVFFGYFIAVPVAIGIIARMVRESYYYLGSGNGLAALVIGMGVAAISAATIAAIYWEKDRALSRGAFYGCLFATVTPVFTLLIVIGICSAG